MHTKYQITAIDIVESWRKDRFLISCVTCVGTIAQVSLANSMINILLFRCADPET